MELEQCINFLLTKTQNKVFQYFKTQLSAYEVTPVQYAILKCLWDHDNQTPTQIAQKLCLDGSTITGLLERMENKGFLQRTNNPDDRRVVIVKLQNPGRQLKDKVNQIISDANDTVLNVLTDQEQALLKELLNKLADSF